MVDNNSIPQAQADVLDSSGKRFTLPWFQFFGALEGLRRLVGEIAGQGVLYLLKASNLSDLASPATAFGNIKQSASGTTTGVVQQTQTWEINFQVPKVTTDPIYPVLKSKRARVVTEIVTRSTSGTCTLTGAIDGTPLGGSANSVSSSEQERAHSSANSISVGQDLVLTASSVSSCLNMKVSVRGTYSLNV